MNQSTAQTPLLDIEALTVHLRVGGSIVKAVDDVTMHVRAGECVGIVGESGSGKSMLARAVLQLFPSVDIERLSGRVRLDGADILTLDADVRSVRRNGITLVFQEPMSHLNPTMRIGRQIEEALGREVPREERRAAVRDALTMAGLPRPERIARLYPHELSGGMRQRVMIALALATQPRVLIADEPTTALDVTVQAQILDTLDRLHRRDGMSIVVITHDLRLVAELCERVYVMYGGQVVEEADTVSLFEHPKHPYTRLLVSSLPGRTAEVAFSTRAPARTDGGDRSGGCGFASRCDGALGRCHSERPALVAVGAAAARCWLWVDEPGTGRGMEAADG